MQENPQVKVVDAPPNNAPDGREGSVPHEDPLLESLVILSRMLGRPCSSEAAVAGLPLVDNKLTPTLFVRAAQRAGLAARIVKRPLGKLSKFVLPAVLLLHDGRACVLESIAENGAAVIVSPETGGGMVTIPLSEMDCEYTGYAIFVRTAFQFDARTKHIVLATTNHWFWDTLKRSWPIYGEVVIASILINIFAVASPLFAMNVYDRVVPNKAVETLWVLASGVAVVYVFDLIMRALRGYFIDIAGKRVDILLSAMLFERMMGIKLAVRPDSVGAFANNLQEFETVREFFTSATLTALIDLPFSLFFVFIIWMIAGSLAWVPLSMIPFVIIASILIQIPLGKMIFEIYKHATQKHATLIESLAGIETIKTSGAEGQRQRLWEDAIGAISRLGLKARFLSASAVNFAGFAQQFTTVIMIVVGVYLIADGQLTMGALVASTILAGRALAPLSQVVATLMRYHQARASLTTLGKLMQMPLERPSEKVFLHRPAFSGKIEFQNVSFRYPGQSIDVLRGVSFRVEAGEKVAFIGRVGSGKTTLEKLILGLYEPTSGSILIDGTDIRQLDPIDIRRNIGYVPQDIMLFFGNIKDNITFGKPHAGAAAVLRAAEIAGVTEFVNRHPSGFDMRVGERGEGLSGGQRQSVAIARALLHDPPILLMDEPSNAMDNSSEGSFKARLRSYVDAKTMILVTHRASLLSLVSRVIVLDQGEVVADGPKEQVLEALAGGQIRLAQA